MPSRILNLHCSQCDARVVRWRELLPLFHPGYLPRLDSFLSRADRSPRLAFAGDYLVAPCVEGALTSGMRAASEVARDLGGRL